MTTEIMEENITIEYDDAGVVKTIFTLPRTKAPDMPSVYVFSLPKAGSVRLGVSAGSHRRARTRA